MINITEREFINLAGFIESNYGIHLKEEKKSLVMGRLHNILTNKGFRSFSDYYDYILSDKTSDAVSMLIDKITTNHTFFMREAGHFHYFKNIVLPYMTGTIKDKDLRIWSAGCSTGEEPYTLAMLIDEYLGAEKRFWDSKVLATDISSRVLGIAENAIYDDKKVASLPTQWKLSYFKKNNPDKYELVERIRKEVIFRRFNLMEPVFPFKRKFHVIFCRNVMIYFDNKTKKELVDKFYRHLEHGGYLFLGHSESLSREISPFQYIMPAVYRKE